MYPLTFTIETLRLVGTAWQSFCTQYHITLVFFGRCSQHAVLLRPRQLNSLMASFIIIRQQKSRKTALSGYVCLLHDLLLMPSGVDTCTHTHTPTFTDETISRNQALWATGLHIPGLKTKMLPNFGGYDMLIHFRFQLPLVLSNIPVVQLYRNSVF